MSPRVTVLMPAFNRERFVDEAIESVVAQDFADFELLIVDDALRMSRASIATTS
jgi:glycosyltransferase involved in cell wall biosynthesis